MTIQYYNSKEERKTLIELAHDKGETVIHDDFISIDNKVTDGNSGKLTFDVMPDITTQLQKMEIEKTLLSKLKDNTITFEEVKSLLKIKFGLE